MGNKLLILTKEDCPQCMILKNFLEYGLGGKYDDSIKFIKKEEDTDSYMLYVEKYSVSSLPAVINDSDGKMVSGTDFVNVQEMLKELSGE